MHFFCPKIKINLVNSIKSCNFAGHFGVKYAEQQEINNKQIL